MTGIACPHCTFLNPPNRVKCGVCLRLLRKRERNESAKSTKNSTKNTDNAKSASSQSAPPTPAQSAQRGEVNSSQSPQRTLPESDTESHTKTVATASLEIKQPRHSIEERHAKKNETPAGDSAQSSLLHASVVPTLFSTASGKTVTVQRETLQKAAERFESAVFSSPSATESGVATLFETASGKKVTVQKNSIERARQMLANYDKVDAETPRTISTLFEIAAGTTVHISEASLRGSREKLEGEEETAEDRSASMQAPARATTAAADAEREKKPSENRAASQSATPGDFQSNFRRLSSPLSDYSVGRRKGFVPPQQRLASNTLGRPRIVTKSSSSSLVSTVVAPQSARLEPLRFTNQSCLSPSISPAPSLAAIMLEDFCFTAADCGPTLSPLLGVKEKQVVRVPQWHAGMLKLGASAKHCTVDWCRHALLSAMFRMSCASRATTASTNVFSAESVLLCLLQAYNTEMVNGERPALRKIVEGDIPSASLVVLYLSSIREERSTPHMRIVTLSDGIYHLKVTCDVPLSNLLREGILKCGQKLAVCGAKSLLHGQCSPTECDTQVVLAINYNCVRAVSSQVPLGVCNGEPPSLPLTLVHPLGGLVPAIEGVVARVLPSFYLAQENESVVVTEDGSRPARDRAIRMIRNNHAQLQITDRLHREMEGAESTKDTRRLSRVTSLLIVKDGAEALVQQWETVEERSLLTDEDGGLSLPMEGSWVTLYAVNPAKSRTAAAPFSHAKLFFSARKLHFVLSKRQLQHLRSVWETTVEKSTTVCVGDAADVCGLFLGHHKNEDGSFVLLLLEGSMYTVLQVPVPSVGRTLSFPIPQAEKTPLLILNATFLTTEDSVAGSDCCRLFANEYTVLLQRSTQRNLREALERAASLRETVEATPQKYAARRTEIFRCLDEGDAFAAGNSTATRPQRSLYVTAEIPLQGDVDEAVGSPTTTPRNLGRPINGSSGFPSAASLPSKEGRLPYYLRQGNSNGGSKLQGVVIPSASNTSTTTQSLSAIPSFSSSTAPVQAPPVGGGLNNSSRHYGNISDLMFVYDLRLNRRAWHPLEDPLPGVMDTSSPLPHSDGFKYVQLCWSVSADSADDLTSRVEEKRTLYEVLEAVCPLHELCSLIADERHIDVSLQRSEKLSQWRKEGHETVWWRFFADSRLLTSVGELDDGAGSFLLWLPGEWAEAIKTISAKLRGALFFFTVRSDALRHTRLISDSCDVRELPHD